MGTDVCIKKKNLLNIMEILYKLVNKRLKLIRVKGPLRLGSISSKMVLNTITFSRRVCAAVNVIQVLRPLKQKTYSTK